MELPIRFRFCCLSSVLQVEESRSFKIPGLLRRELEVNQKKLERVENIRGKMGTP